MGNVKTLLRHGLQLDAIDSDGNTPLVLACQKWRCFARTVVVSTTSLQKSSNSDAINLQ
nr:hypothetical protein [uncultured Rhodoferax sp.]